MKKKKQNKRNAKCVITNGGRVEWNGRLNRWPALQSCSMLLCSFIIIIFPRPFESIVWCDYLRWTANWNAGLGETIINRTALTMWESDRQNGGWPNHRIYIRNQWEEGAKLCYAPKSNGLSISIKQAEYKTCWRGMYMVNLHIKITIEGKRRKNRRNKTKPYCVFMLQKRKSKQNLEGKFKQITVATGIPINHHATK